MKRYYYTKKQCWVTELPPGTVKTELPVNNVVSNKYYVSQTVLWNDQRNEITNKRYNEISGKWEYILFDGICYHLAREEDIKCC